MINLTSIGGLVYSLVSNTLGDDKFVFFISNEGVLEFTNKNNYLFNLIVSGKEDEYLRVYDNRDVYLIKNTLCRDITEVKADLVFAIESVARDLREFYKFEYEKVVNGHLYKFYKKVG